MIFYPRFLGVYQVKIRKNTIPIYHIYLYLLQVVGSQARILYSDQKGRIAIALAFNKAIAEGKLKVTRQCFFIELTVFLVLRRNEITSQFGSTTSTNRKSPLYCYHSKITKATLTHSPHLQGPVVLSRDHHDVSGTDSPFRETSNIYDGSAFCADMAVQNCVGDSFRGATWVALHNGGGVGWYVFCHPLRTHIMY